MKQKITLLFLLLFGAHVLPAQLDSTFHRLEQYEARTLEALRRISFLTSSSSNHSLYLDKNWQHSFVITTQEEVLAFNGRYNILNHGIELKDGDQIRTLYPERIRIARVGESILLPLRGDEVEGIEELTYFELLAGGPVKLLNRPHYKTVTVSSNTLVPQVTGDDKQIVDEEFFYLKNGRVRKLRASRKKVLDIFGADKQEELEAFMKEYHLRMNRREDLVTLFDHYQEIVR